MAMTLVPAWTQQQNWVYLDAADFRAQHFEPAGSRRRLVRCLLVRDGGRELCDADVMHPALDDRVLDAEKVGNSCFHVLVRPGVARKGCSGLENRQMDAGFCTY